MYFIGIDIGGTKCAVSLGNQQDRRMYIVHKKSFPTVPGRPNDTLYQISQVICTILKSFNLPTTELSGIGISCGGPLDSKKGIILSPPNLPGWDNIHVTEFIKKEFNVNTYLQNDANACAVAEWKYGAGKGYDNVIFLTFGTGLGAGLILSGRLYSGTNDMAGEIGHIRLAEDGPLGYGKSGSMEGFCSGGGIGQLGRISVKNRDHELQKSALYSLAENSEAINAKYIADFADQGDLLCKKIYQTSGERLGQGLSILIDILNPEIIIIGSIFVRSHHLLWDSAKQVVEREALKRSSSVCKIVPAGLGEAVGDYAALSVATGEY